VEASGFVSHLKLPHYVDFQAELGLLRDLRKISRMKRPGAEPEAEPEKSRPSPSEAGVSGPEEPSAGPTVP
jgi:hypothetical protein